MLCISQYPMIILCEFRRFCMASKVWYSGLISENKTRFTDQLNQIFSVFLVIRAGSFYCWRVSIQAEVIFLCFYDIGLTSDSCRTHVVTCFNNHNTKMTRICTIIALFIIIWVLVMYSVDAELFLLLSHMLPDGHTLLEIVGGHPR